MIPYTIMFRKMKNKLSELGIELVFVNESYTSKCSFIDKEEMKKQDEYKGKRVKRGLFRSESGILINSDVNGSVNIMRKVVGDAVYSQPILGLMLNPLKIREVFSNFHKEIC